MENSMAVAEADAASADAGAGSSWSGRRRSLRAYAVAGCVVVGGVLLLTQHPKSAPRPAASPGPAGRAVIAASAGAPASLSDLTALIREREAQVQENPGNDRTWAALGAAYVERGTRTADSAFYPKAERALRGSLAARPHGNVDALDGLAALAAARGDWSTARKWGAASVGLAPNRWRAYAVLVDAYRGLGDYAAAGKSLDKLSGLTTGTAVTLRTAAVYRDRGWREDAAAVLSDAAARAATPTERAALLSSGGDLAWERGEPQDALRRFRAASTADPHYPAALAGQARALASLGRTDEAVRAYRRALAEHPSPEYALELGELYEAQGLAGPAGTQYDALRTWAAARGANGVDDALILGRFEADHGDARAAVVRLRAEWDRAPNLRTADALGWALHRDGRDGEAIELLRRTTDRQKDGTVRDALFSYHRGSVERALGLPAPARRHLDEALRINPEFSPLFAPRARQELATVTRR
ncbi:tetratricopeptide repeat protein [Streptomyces sp. NPDC046939]|uniref:tetratricopeptide repeat protein n=1 Tax=Streptomyces sp. NPDC046939 TaxID=3155376 RepID=UPI0033FC6F0C